jgi:hypothetical protein
LISKARSEQCRNVEGKRGRSELSTVNNDSEDAAELNTIDSDVESSFGTGTDFDKRRASQN